MGDLEGMAVPQNQSAPNPIPPAPQGVDAQGWQKIISEPPAGASGPYPYNIWAQAIEILRADPSPQNKAFFDKHFAPAGYTADSVLSTLNPAPAGAAFAAPAPYVAPVAVSPPGGTPERVFIGHGVRPASNVVTATPENAEPFIFGHGTRQVTPLTRSGEETTPRRQRREGRNIVSEAGEEETKTPGT